MQQFDYDGDNICGPEVCFCSFGHLEPATYFAGPEKLGEALSIQQVVGTGPDVEDGQEGGVSRGEVRQLHVAAPEASALHIPAVADGLGDIGEHVLGQLHLHLDEGTHNIIVNPRLPIIEVYDSLAHVHQHHLHVLPMLLLQETTGLVYVHFFKRLHHLL